MTGDDTGDTPSTGATETPCDASKEKVQIGVVTILTGDAASLGTSAKDGVDAYVRHVNARGGVNGSCVEVQARDSQLSVERAVQAVTELSADERIKGIVGPLTSGQVEASLQVARDNQVIMISPSATRTNLTGQIPYFFRTIPSDGVQGPSQASIVFNDFGVNQVAVLFQQNAYGAGLKDSFVAEFTRLGGSILGEPVAFESGRTETFAAKAVVVKNLNPQFVVVEGQEPDSPAMIKALRDAGYTGRILTSEAVESDNAITVGGAALNGVYFTKAAPDQDNPDYLAFANATEVGAFTAQGYDAALVIVETLKAVGADATADEMRSHIIATTFDGTVSADRIGFNQQGDLAAGTYALWWIQDGKFQPAPAPE